MDSNINVGNNRVFKEPSELDAQNYDVIDYPDTAGKKEGTGFCNSISKAFRAVYEAPTCVKVMGALGVLCLAGSAISAYTAFTAMQTRCKLMDAPKPNPQNPTTSPAEVSQAAFNEVIPKLPVVVLTAQKTEVKARGNHDGHTNRCIINGKLIGGGSKEKCRTAHTGQKIDTNCRQRKFDFRADVTKYPRSCELSEMKIKDVYHKKFSLYETCSIYDATGVNTEDNIPVQCINLPKTPLEAREALFELGKEIGSRLKDSPNFKHDNMTASAQAYEQISAMAEAYDEYGLQFNLGHSLKGGFFKAMRGEDPEMVNSPFPQKPTSAPTDGAPTESPKMVFCEQKIDGARHATSANAACGLGALGFVMLFGSLLSADFGKANVTVKVGVPKDNKDMMVLSYNGVTHHYDMREVTFSSNFNHDLTVLIKFLIDKGEDIGEAYELALEVCDKVDMRTGTTAHGDKAMNSVRCFLRENHEQAFTKYLIAMGIEDPENKNGGCWLSSIFNWGSTPTNQTHTPVPKIARAVPEITEEPDEPVYAGIPLQFIRSSGATTPPAGASTPHTQVRAQIVSEENRYSMGDMSDLDMELGDLDKGFSQSLGSLTDGTYRKYS